MRCFGDGLIGVVGEDRQSCRDGQAVGFDFMHGLAQTRAEVRPGHDELQVQHIRRAIFCTTGRSRPYSARVAVTTVMVRMVYSFAKPGTAVSRELLLSFVTKRKKQRKVPLLRMQRTPP